MIDKLTVTVLAEDSVGYETPFLGQHGISLLVEAERSGYGQNGEIRDAGVETDTAAAPTRMRVLMDVAQHPEPLLHNMERMKIEPSSIDAIVLTHCHYDHTQGLVRMIEEIGRPGLPVIAHPELFRPNFEIEPRLRPIGVPPTDRRELVESTGAHLMLSRTPLQLLPGLTTSGEIPRTTDYEGTNPGLFTLREGKLEPDPMMDDISLYAHVAGRGVVVLSGCSHAGIVNIVRHARTVCAPAKNESKSKDRAGTGVAAVMGGLHLITADQTTIESTVARLRDENVGQVLAGHCTGFTAQTALYHEFGRRFRPLYTGLVAEWSAAGGRD